MTRPLQCATALSLSIALMGHAAMLGLGCTFGRYSAIRQQLVLRDDWHGETATVVISRTGLPHFRYELGAVSSPAFGRRVTRLLRAFARETQAPLMPTLAVQAA